MGLSMSISTYRIQTDSSNKIKQDIAFLDIFCIVADTHEREPMFLLLRHREYNRLFKEINRMNRKA